MDVIRNLLIVGASTRAAAFSALRAGFQPRCADLFADADLQARCPVQRLPGRYPHGFLDWIDAQPPGPLMYVGGLENRTSLVEQISRRRLLWGNGPEALSRVRSPLYVANLVRGAGLTAPAVQLQERGGEKGRWLVKPLAGAGGAGIRFWEGQAKRSRIAPRHYLQEFIEGASYSAVFVGDGQRAWLLGVSRQLVGETWLQAAAFHYCGSIGPVALPSDQRRDLEKLGTALAAGCQLRGLFGVDGVKRDGRFWPVEVNPRYTASVEVHEYATGLQAMAWHRRAFRSTGLFPALPPSIGRIVGKAILFARAPLVFPAAGPWVATVHSPLPLAELPAFADVPPVGQTIEAGRPILTFFAEASSRTSCEEKLQWLAAELDRWLYH